MLGAGRIGAVGEIKLIRPRCNGGSSELKPLANAGATTIFSQAPPLAAGSLATVMDCPLPAGDKFSASRTVVVWPKPAAGSRGMMVPIIMTARSDCQNLAAALMASEHFWVRLEMRVLRYSATKRSLGFNRVVTLVVVRRVGNLGAEVAAAVKSVRSNDCPVRQRLRKIGGGQHVIDAVKLAVDAGDCQIRAGLQPGNSCT